MRKKTGFWGQGSWHGGGSADSDGLGCGRDRLLEGAEKGIGGGMGGVFFTVAAAEGGGKNQSWRGETSREHTSQGRSESSLTLGICHFTPGGISCTYRVFLTVKSGA